MLHIEITHEKSGLQLLENSGREEKKEDVSDSFWSRGHQDGLRTISSIYLKYWTFLAQKNRLEGRSGIEEKTVEKKWRTEMGFPNQILRLCCGATRSKVQGRFGRQLIQYMTRRPDLQSLFRGASEFLPCAAE